jgi:hypothetical protein
MAPEINEKIGGFVASASSLAGVADTGNKLSAVSLLPVINYRRCHGMKIQNKLHDQ